MQKYFPFMLTWTEWIVVEAVRRPLQLFIAFHHELFSLYILFVVVFIVISCCSCCFFSFLFFFCLTTVLFRLRSLVRVVYVCVCVCACVCVCHLVCFRFRPHRTRLVYPLGKTYTLPAVNNTKTQWNVKQDGTRQCIVIVLWIFVNNNNTTIVKNRETKRMKLKENKKHYSWSLYFSVIIFIYIFFFLSFVWRRWCGLCIEACVCARAYFHATSSRSIRC